MAARKKKDLGPHLDGNQPEQDKATRVQYTMAEVPFNSAIRAVMSAERGRVMAVRQATFDNLKRLGIPRNPKAAPAKLPLGSDQVDFGSLITWMARIPTKAYKQACRQLQVLDAAAVARTP